MFLSGELYNINMLKIFSIVSSNIFFRNKKNGRKGFTLVELLVVITIIGILSSIAYIGFENMRASARDDTRISDLAKIRMALKLYYIDNDAYPVNGYEISIGGPSSFDQEFSSALQPKYIKVLPTDPSYPQEYEAGLKYYYVYIAGSEGYNLCAKMEVRFGFACFDEKTNSGIFYIESLGS